MAVQDPQTANIALPLKVSGHVALQKSVKRGFEIIDTEIAAIKARLNVIEGNLGGDSNSEFFDN